MYEYDYLIHTGVISHILLHFQTLQIGVFLENRLSSNMADQYLWKCSILQKL